MKRILSIMVVLAITVSTQAQKTVKLDFVNLLDGIPIKLNNTKGKNDLGHEFNVSRLEYYISGITLIHDGGQETEAKDVYLLIDANKQNIYSIGEYNITNLESVSFHVGVPPSVNNSDPGQWEQGHPLALKVPSMHWGWASGYRFVAMEGKAGPSLTAGYEMHALGNKNYFKQNIAFVGTDAGGVITFQIYSDFSRALAGLDLESGFVEHGEDPKAAQFLRYCQTSVFYNQDLEGNTLNVEDIKVTDAVTLYPNPSSGAFKLELKDSRFSGADVIITNALGQEVVTLNAVSQITDIAVLDKGIYFVTVRKEGFTSTEKLIIR